MLKNSTLEYQLSRIDEWTRGADQKISIFLAFQVAILALTLPTLARLKSVESSWILFLLILSGLIFLYSIWKTLAALIPRLRNLHRPSLIYFGEIATIQLSDFTKGIANLDEGEYAKQLLEQIHTNSRIASRKHIHFRDSIILFVVAVVLWITSYLPIILTTP